MPISAEYTDNNNKHILYYYFKHDLAAFTLKDAFFGGHINHSIIYKLIADSNTIMDCNNYTIRLYNPNNTTVVPSDII